MTDKAAQLQELQAQLNKTYGAENATDYFKAKATEMAINYGEKAGLDTKNSIVENLQPVVEQKAEEVLQEVVEEETQQVEEAVEEQVEEAVEEEVEQDLYNVTVNGKEIQVTLDELIKGYSREADYTQKTQKVAEARKEIEAKKQQVSQYEQYLEQARNEAISYLDVAGSLLYQQIGINSDQELARLAQEDPQEYVRKSAKIEELKRLVATRKHLDEQRLLEQKQKELTNEQEEFKILIDKMPELNDAKRRQEFAGSLLQYLRDNGVENPVLKTHQEVILAYKAYLYDKAQSAKEEIKKKVVPSTGSVKQSVRHPAQVSTQDPVKAALQSIQRGQSSDDSIFAAQAQLILGKNKQSNWR